MLHRPVLVEIVAKTDRRWRDHLRGERPRWVYAFLDGGRALFDDGSIDRLQQLSRTVYDNFVTPAEVKQELATVSSARSSDALTGEPRNGCGRRATSRSHCSIGSARPTSSASTGDAGQ
jgi:hypothetical protein